MPADFGIKKCEYCGKEIICKIRRDITRKRFCSRRCLGLYSVKMGWLKCDYSEKTRQKMRKSKLKLLKTGWRPVGWRAYDLPIRLSGRGYYFKGNKRLHTILMEEKLGRKLIPNEVVHHKDFNKLNNLLDNLVVMTRSCHMKLHTQVMKTYPARF